MVREARTENGMVRGIETADPRIVSFKGIPFAAPPVGKNRWRAPQPCENWEGVRDASRFAPVSVQDTPGIGDSIYNREWHVDPDIAMSEDCLYLNIWTGARTPGEKLPVLVWYFGGALQWGYPSEMEFDGEHLARRGIVVVSVNYRINVFGFLAHPQLTAEQREAPANFGSLDQKAGLEWVIRNIEAFGGDPENITIAGQSAGGGSVMAQMTCPDNFGKFQRAVVMSAMIRSPYGEAPAGKPKSLTDAERLGCSFFDFLGVKDLEEARELDAFYIRDRYAAFAEEHPRMGFVQDDRFCVGDPYELFLMGKHAKVPVLAGNTADEFPNAIQAGNEAELRERAKELFGEKAEEFLNFPESLVRTEAGYGTVSGIECSVKRAFLEHGRNGLEENCYYYRFDADIPGWDNPGTFHSVDLWFFFETLGLCWRPFRGRHYDLARQMCSYLANFARTGNPNGRDTDGTQMPEWRPYTEESAFGMVFGSNGAVGSDTEEERIRFLTEWVPDGRR